MNPVELITIAAGVILLLILALLMYSISFLKKIEELNNKYLSDDNLRSSAVEDPSKKLYVITCISNPRKYKSRYKLYREFKEYMSTVKGVELYTVEHAFKDRPFEITEAGDPYAIQVRGDQEFWHKENLLNIGLQHLPKEAKYIAWIDADVRFLNPNWVQDTIDSLDSHDFVQMFSEYIDLGPNGEHLSKMTSFIYAYVTGEEQLIDTRYGNGRKGATGLAWAATREAIDNVGGLIDWCIVGSGDWHMAYCLIGKGVEIAQSWFSPGYRNLLEKFQADCDRYIRNNVGYVPGVAVHYWHGPKSKRGYGWRWAILRDNNFDPVLDLKKDTQGLYIVNREKLKLHDDLREYFRSRDEDSTSLV